MKFGTYKFDFLNELIFQFSLKYLDSDVLLTESKSEMEMSALMPHNGLTNYFSVKSFLQSFNDIENN